MADDSLRNALDWIYRCASLHYIGGAFDPEHMWGIANVAADALQGRIIPAPPDRDEVLESARQSWLEYAECVD